MLGFDENSLKKRSFSSSRILVETCLRFFIKGWVFLSLGEFGCEVFVKELCCSSAGYVAPNCSHGEIKVSPRCLCPRAERNVEG